MNFQTDVLAKPLANVNSENFVNISFSRVALYDTFFMLKIGD